MTWRFWRCYYQRQSYNQKYADSHLQAAYNYILYRRQAGNFQGFDLRMNPCTTLCLCMLCNRLCPGLGYWFLCC